MPTDPAWRVLLLVIVLLWLRWAWYRRPQLRPSPGAVRRQRLLKPRTPADCRACRRHSALPVAFTPPPPMLTPGCAVKSRRGAPKRIDTQGFAWLNRRWAYDRITDAQIHALVGDGGYGRRERIQTLRCQAWGATFSTRRDTPLSRLTAASQRVADVLTALAEGLALAAAVRVCGQRPTTLTRWLTRAGAHSATLHDRVVRGRHLPHIPFDERRPRLRNRTSPLWRWLARDPLTKIIPVLQRGA